MKSIAFEVKTHQMEPFFWYWSALCSWFAGFMDCYENELSASCVMWAIKSSSTTVLYDNIIYCWMKIYPANLRKLIARHWKAPRSIEHKFSFFFFLQAGDSVRILLSLKILLQHDHEHRPLQEAEDVLRSPFALQTSSERNRDTFWLLLMTSQATPHFVLSSSFLQIGRLWLCWQ